jgi:two-component system sensor histidine kinase RstB
MPLKDGKGLIRLGPLPKVKQLAAQSINTAMSLWFAIVIGSTGWLVYTVSKKFRNIEIVARKIAEGNFDSRVDESQAGESKVLASAFNLMASKTESSIRSKKELLQVVSHELRTPLSRLRFAVELLEASDDPDLKQSRMMVVRQSIDNLDSIVDEVLDYVRNEDDSPRKSREWIEIQPVIKPMIQVFEMEHPKLEFDWVFSGPSPCTDIYADRLVLHRAIGNLLSNAVRYAKSKVRIHVYRSSIPSMIPDVSSPQLSTVCIEVEDDGPGIPENKRIEVLSPFVRLSPDDSKSQSENSHLTVKASDPVSQTRSSSTHAGLGLGLAIVQRSLRQHGGTISIHQGSLGGCLVRTQWPIRTTA